MKSDIPAKKEKPGKASKERTGVVSANVIHARKQISTVLILNQDTIVRLQSLAAIAQGLGTFDSYTSNAHDVMALAKANKLNIKNISYPITVEMWLPNMIDPSMPAKSRKSRTGKQS